MTIDGIAHSGLFYPLSARIMKLGGWTFIIAKDDIS
jgi:hypothetical protein